MTEQDRRSVAHLIRRVSSELPNERVKEYAARLVEHYEADRPCRYDPLCVVNGRCPFDPVCNN